MPDKPDTRPRRRWFQLRLRTLLVGVVVLSIPCGYVAHESRIVTMRRAMLEIGKGKPVIEVQFGNDDKIPMVRRWLGDRGIHWFVLYYGSPIELEQQYKAAFPECDPPAPPPPILHGPEEGV